MKSGIPPATITERGKGSLENKVWHRSLNPFIHMAYADVVVQRGRHEMVFALRPASVASSGGGSQVETKGPAKGKISVRKG